MELNREARDLLRKIVEGQAYRLLMLANIRAHGLKFVPELEGKTALAQDLGDALRQVADVQALYARVSDAGLLAAVRKRMERIPYPTSRLELALCLFLCERVERAALLAYTDSASEELAAVSKSRVARMRAADVPDDPAFLEYCADPTNRPHAQALFNRWLAVTLVALGRPDSPGDARAVELGLRSRRVARIVREYLDELGPFLARTGLALPEAATLGIELPQPRIQR